MSKKGLGFCLFLLLACAGIASADTYCIQFADFCDQIEVDFDGKLSFGFWDTDCSGSFAEVTMGVSWNNNRQGSLQVHGGDGAEWLLLFNGPTSTYRAFASYGSKLVEEHTGLSYRLSPGACPAPLVGGPSALMTLEDPCPPCPE